MRVGFSTKATMVLVSLMLVALFGAAAALYHAWQTEGTVDELISSNSRDMITATGLEAVLLQQKGYVGFYLMDGNRKWLEELADYKPRLLAALKRVEEGADSEAEQRMVAALKKAYDDYELRRNEIVALYERGERKAAWDLYSRESPKFYKEAILLCDRILAANEQNINHALRQSREGIRRLTILLTVSVILTMLFGSGLAWLFVREVLVPMRRIGNDLRTLSADGHLPPMGSGQDDPADLCYYLGTLMTEISETKSNLEDSRRKLLHSERLAAIGNAMAHIAHEIRNPLSTIGGFARALEKKPTDAERVREKAATICREVSRLEGLLTEVMSFSRPIQVEHSLQSLNSVVQRTIDTFAEQGGGGVSIETSLDPSLPDVMMNEDRLVQVILNVVKNSIEALGSQGRVTIRTKPAEGGATLVVQDDGPGIPEEIKEKLFEPFFTTKKKGNGLGLAICRQIILEHGGEIRVESTPGQGAAFTITLRSG